MTINISPSLINLTCISMFCLYKTMIYISKFVNMGITCKRFKILVFLCFRVKKTLLKCLTYSTFKVILSVTVNFVSIVNILWVFYPYGSNFMKNQHRSVSKENLCWVVMAHDCSINGNWQMNLKKIKLPQNCSILPYKIWWKWPPLEPKRCLKTIFIQVMCSTNEIMI